MKLITLATNEFNNVDQLMKIGCNLFKTSKLTANTGSYKKSFILEVNTYCSFSYNFMLFMIVKKKHPVMNALKGMWNEYKHK